MMAEIVYLNGSLVPRPEARLSIDDHGFLYGYGLFETMRAYNGVIFLLERHVRRLTEGAKAIGLAARLGGIDLAGACRDTLRANGLKEARLRLTVSGGEGEPLPWAETGDKPTVLVTARGLTPLPDGKYERGCKVLLSSLRRCPQSPLSRIKSANYLVSVLARVEAAAAGYDEALLLNESGSIAEGGSSNIFFVGSGSLVTPSLESGVLPGITRAVVMELAGALGVGVSEGEVSPDELGSFDEAFLTGSVMEIMPLVSVTSGGRGITIGNGQPGPVTQHLMAAYRGMVVRETA
jgi:branched-chain amino acid aminotransferase